MKTNWLRSALTASTALLALSGCASEVSDEEPITRENARAMIGKFDVGVDYCDLYGWYADGVCDDFCVEPDPDCGTCAAIPSCEAWETQYDDWRGCPADASCREVTECGATIWCSSTEAPVCAGENPQGCVSTGCDLGYHCDTAMGLAPTFCYCDPEAGVWTCSADLSGGVCVPD